MSRDTTQTSVGSSLTSQLPDLHTANLSMVIMDCVTKANSMARERESILATAWSVAPRVDVSNRCQMTVLGSLVSTSEDST